MCVCVRARIGRSAGRRSRASSGSPSAASGPPPSAAASGAARPVPSPGPRAGDVTESVERRRRPLGPPKDSDEKIGDDAAVRAVNRRRVHGAGSRQGPTRPGRGDPEGSADAGMDQPSPQRRCPGRAPGNARVQPSLRLQTSLAQGGVGGAGQGRAVGGRGGAARCGVERSGTERGGAGLGGAATAGQDSGQKASRREGQGTRVWRGGVGRGEARGAG